MTNHNSLDNFRYGRQDQWNNLYILIKGENSDYDKLADQGYVSKDKSGFGYFCYTLTIKGKKALGLI